MISKELLYIDAKPMVQVTFTLPNSFWADSIHLVGDFNDWDQTTHPLLRVRGGAWMIRVILEPNKVYQFRYLIESSRWTNDDNADAYVRNLHGSDNSVVITDINFEKQFEKSATHIPSPAPGPTPMPDTESGDKS